MPKLNWIAQAVSKSTHAATLKKILGAEQIKYAIVSVAFIREAGVAALEKEIKSLAGKIEFFIGIRNGITSAQAIQRLLDAGAKITIIDTATQDVIFHPKIYLAVSANSATLISGSANMTFNGLHNNIEASMVIELDSAIPDECAAIDDISTTFRSLEKLFPENVFKVSKSAQISKLLEDGRLEDELIVRRPPAQSSINRESRDKTPRMKLHRVAPPPQNLKAKPGKKAGTAVAATSRKRKGLTLVWQSEGLTERDLNIPHGKNTNPTGSMGLKKGAMEDIDQRHYFRDEVFDGLNWVAGTRYPHKERAVASFEIVIGGISYGSHSLTISHNTDTSSRSYEQGNMMTHLHWGDVKPLIATPDLLDRTLRLYRGVNVSSHYLIEID